MAQLPTIRDAMKTGQVDRCAFAPRWKSLKPCTRWQPPTTTSTVGVHRQRRRSGPSFDDLVQRARCQVVGIGETGLDYFRLGERTVAWHGSAFSVHIRAARQTACRW
jgi:TatD DNase family protein